MKGIDTAIHAFSLCEEGGGKATDAFCMIEEPPLDGIKFYLKMDPVSLQAKRVKKDLIAKLVHSAIRDFNFFYSGEVAVRIEWTLSEQQRYHKPTSPDIDNIIKVLLDALAGPKGIIFNDFQVQSVGCYWVTPGISSPLTIWVTPLDSDAWIRKNGIVFLKVIDKLCLPLSGNLFKHKETVTYLRKMATAYKALILAGENYDAAKSVLPIQKLYHSAKLVGFRIVGIEDSDIK